MGGNAGRQIRCVVGKMGKVQPHADTHPIQMCIGGSARFEQYAGNFSPAHQDVIRPFYGNRTIRSDERGNRIGQCKPGHKTQLSGPLRLNAPGLINGGHQISLRRLPHPTATPATGALGIGQNPMRLNHPLSRQPFGFFIGAVQCFKVEQLIGIGKCDHLMSAGPKSPVSNASGAAMSISAWLAPAARSINGAG